MAVSVQRMKLPQWSLKIEELRRFLGLTQAGLAERLKVSPMSVSRWERGVQEPSAQVFIHLGNLASGIEKWFFWELAGLQQSDVSGLAETTQAFIVPATESMKKAAKRHPVTAIPLIDVKIHSNSGTGGPTDLKGEPVGVLATPAAWCPNAEFTVCARVSGDSMSPSIPDSSIICIDTSIRNSARLQGKVVVGCHPSRGLRLGRLQHKNHYDSLVPENRSYAPISFEGGWSVLGEVIWWIVRNHS